MEFLAEATSESDALLADQVAARFREYRSALGGQVQATVGWVATVVALGRPAHPRKRLRRRPVHSFTTVDRADGPAFDTAQEGSP